MANNIDKLKAELLAEEFPNLQIQYLISKGDTGEIYAAIQEKLDRRVSLKVLAIEHNDDDDRKRRFIREARALSQLSHPNLVRLYDYGENDYFSWMLLEWIEGKTLEKINIQNELQLNDALALVCKVCDILSHAHENGIVHRDVKPSHILIAENGEVKLSDFGLARETQSSSNSLVSDSGDKFGSVEYSAPEFWTKGSLIDHRADIFSLGVLLYEVLTGSRAAGVFRMPSELKPDLDPRLDGIIAIAMQEFPDDRYQSCKDFMNALQEVIDVPYEQTLLSMEHTIEDLKTNKNAQESIEGNEVELLDDISMCETAPLENDTIIGGKVAGKRKSYTGAEKGVFVLILLLIVMIVVFLLK